MAKIQDIDIPYLEFAEAAAPGTPASGIVRIYAKTDGSLYQKDDAGTETGLAGGGGGSDGYGPSGVYSPDRPPASGTVSPTDEFDDGSVAGGWGWTGTTPTYDETTYPGFLYVDTAKNITNKFRIAYVPGATAFTVAAKVALAVRNQDNAAMTWGIATFDSSDNTLWEIYLQTSGSAATVDDVRIFGTAGTGGTTKVGFGRWVYLALQRDASGVYTAYWSLNGMIWNLFGSSTVGTTVAKVGFTIPTNDNNGNNRQALTDFIRVFSSATLKIGA